MGNYLKSRLKLKTNSVATKVTLILNEMNNKNAEKCITKKVIRLLLQKTIIYHFLRSPVTILSPQIK